MYDVLVVGAGPAGCTAAKRFAQMGLRVLLAERHPLPRYKSCSGILIRKTLALTSRYFGASVPDFVACAPAENKGMVFFDDKGTEYRFAQSGLNVWRSAFDGWLAELARSGGAHVWDGVSVLACREENGGVAVTLRDSAIREEHFRFVLNCEGAAGSLRQKLLGERREFITTFQAFYEGTIGLDPHYFYAYLLPELSEYDAWFNVKDGMLVIGVSARDPGRIKLYHERFLQYLRERHGLQIERQIRSEKWLMPRVRPGCPITFGKGHVLFAGEAADFLNPMGEGISAGMESAFHAANAIAANWDDLEAVYAQYERSVRPLKSYMLRQWALVAKLSASFSEMQSL